jgi:hypothetical protein
MALNDHMLDPNTYRNISPLEARMDRGQILSIIKDWIKTYKNVLSKNEEQFIKRSLAQNKDPFVTLCLLMKVHKPVLSSQAIISGSGSLLHSLGIWADSHLQQFAKARPACFKSSRVLKSLLGDLVLPPNIYLFTADAVSMYSNIPTRRAIEFISEHIRWTSRQFNNVPVEALCEALRSIITSNVFTFGDTSWKQFKSTTMGTPPAPPWANIYYSLCEGHFLPLFQ